MPALQPINWGMGIPFRNHGKTYPAVLAVRGVFDPWLIKGLGRPRPILKQLGPSWWWPTAQSRWWPCRLISVWFWGVGFLADPQQLHGDIMPRGTTASWFFLYLFFVSYLAVWLCFPLFLHCLILLLAIVVVVVVVIVTVVVLVIVPVVAVVAFVLLLVGLCRRLSCFQHQLEPSALSALSAGCIDPPVISIISAKATVDLPNILEHLRSCQSSPEGTWVNDGSWVHSVSGHVRHRYGRLSGWLRMQCWNDGKRHSYQVRWTRPFLPAFELCLSKRKKVSMKSCWWNLMTKVTRV